MPKCKECLHSEVCEHEQIQCFEGIADACPFFKTRNKPEPLKPCPCCGCKDIKSQAYITTGYYNNLEAKITCSDCGLSLTDCLCINDVSFENVFLLINRITSNWNKRIMDGEIND